MQSTWQYPSTRRRGRPPRIYCDTDMSTDNYFSGLSDDDNGDPGPSRSKRSRKDPTSQNSTTAAVPKKPPAPKRPPPIIIPNLNHAQVIEILKTAPINNKQYSKRLTSDGFKIFTENVQDYKQLKSHLASVSTNHYSFTLEEDLQSRYVVYGLPEIDIKVIREAINHQIQKDPTDIKKMKILKPKYEGQSHYLIYFRKSEQVKLQALKSITVIEGYHVFWSHYRRDNTPTLCRNCGQYFHSARNCAMPTSCLRCCGNHKTSECIHLDKETGLIPEEHLRCIQCGRQHGAASAKCKVRQQIIESRLAEIANRKRTLNTKRYVNTLYNYPESYPSIVDSGRRLKPKTQPTVPKKNVSYQPAPIPENNFWQTPPDQRFQSSARLSQKQCPTNNNSNSDLFTPGQLMQIFRECIGICNDSINKFEQLSALSFIIEKHLLND